MERSIRELLQNCFLFKDVDNSYLDQFLKDGNFVRREFSKNEIVLNDTDENPPCLALVEEGCLRVFGQSEEKTVLLNTLTDGDVFGMAYLFCDDRSSVSQIVSTKRSYVWFIPAEKVEWLICHNGQAAINYISCLSGKIRFLNKRIGECTAKNAECKLAMYLASQPVDSEGNITLKMPASRLANHLGVSRATLYRCMEELERDGYIKRAEKGIINIPDFYALKKYSERNN